MTPIQHLMTKKVANNNIGPMTNAVHSLFDSVIKDLQFARDHPEIHNYTAAQYLDKQIAIYETTIVNLFPDIYE